MKNKQPETELKAARKRISELEEQLEEKTKGPPPAGEIYGESASRFNALFKTMSQGVVYQDANGMITLANPAAERILGLTLDEMQGRKSVDPRWRAIHEDGSDFPGEQHPAMVALHSGEAVNDVVMGVYHPQIDEYRWLLVSAVPEFRVEETRPYQVYTTFTDITERKQTEKILRQWADAFQHCAHGIAIGSATSNYILTCNPAFARLQGRTVEEISKMPILSMYVPEDHARIKQTIAEADHSGYVRYEAHMVRKDGSIYPVQMDLVSVRDENGKLLYRVATQQDITERKLAEETLQKSEERYRHTLDNMMEGCQIIDFDWRYSLVNEAVAKQSHFGKDNLLHHTMMEMYPGIENTELFSVLRDCMENRVVRQLENYFVYPNGSSGWFNLSVQPVPEGIFILSIDITERKRVEALLKDSEAQYRNIFESMQEIFFVCEIIHDNAGKPIDYRYLEANPACLSRAGRRREEMIGHTYLELFRPNPTFDFWLSHFNQVSLSGEPDHFEHYAEATGMYFEASAYSPRSGLCAVVMNDITERKQMEDMLRQSENDLAEAQRVAKLGSWRIFISSNIVRWSQELYRIFDVEPTTFEGLRESFLSCVYPDDKPRVLEANRQAEEDGTPFEIEYRVTTRDSQLKYIREIGYATQDTSGKVRSVFGITQDITDFKQVEESLRRRTEELEQLLEMLPETIWIAEDPQCSVIHGNRFANQLLNVPEKTNISQSSASAEVILRQFSQGRELSPGELPLQSAIRTSLPQLDIELRIERPDHITRTLLGGAIPLFNAQGQTRGAVAVFHDITERKFAEEELHRTLDELRRSNAELEQFAYVASHDLQEPLRSVASMVHLLQMRYQGKLDERADEYIDLAVEGANRMKALINDLLVYSRVDRYGKPLEPINTQQALDYALANLQIAISESGAAVTHDELPTVMADPTQLAQLFQNLVSNAIKFRGERKPEIHIRAKKITNAYQFSVSDNGIGIESQYFERIFLVFQRLHTRREYSGTGIGLALCKKIIERHGGQIWVESEPGQGSTFHFTLPYTSKPH